MGGWSIYKDVIQIVSDSMIYIPGFIKTGPGTGKLIKGDSQTHSDHGERIRKVG